MTVCGATLICCVEIAGLDDACLCYCLCGGFVGG